MALHDVQVLREVVKKLIPMITGRGVRVTQMGSQAYVLHDRRTGKIERVNIPHLPDDADEALILATQGFIDHECGHVLDTDWKSVAESETIAREIATEQKIDFKVTAGRLHNLANIVEDPFVEGRMQKRFPGVAFNLDKLYAVFIKRSTMPALAMAKSDADRFSYLLVPIIRSLSGQKFFTDFLDAGKHWDEPLVKAFTDRLTEPLLKEIRTVKSSWDGLDVARQLYDILYPAPPPPPPPPPPAPPAPPAKEEESSGESEKPGDGIGESDKPEDEDDEGAGGEEMTDEPPEDISKPEPEAEHAEDEAEPEPEPEPEAEPEPADDDDLEPAEPAGDAGEPAEPEPEPEAKEDVSASAETADEAAEESGAPSEKPKEADEDETDVEAGSDTDDEAEAASGEGDEATAGDAGKEEEEPSPFSELDLPESKDLAEAISDIITEDATRGTRSADYRVYTTEWDVIAPLEVGSEYNPKWLEELDSKTRHMVAPMQKEIERMMAARSQIVKVPGFRSGRLHSGSLHRLRVNDDRVFRRTQENHSTATAVSLVIDNSGSMGYSKTQTSMAAAYALSQTLERLKITNEVIGFTTKHLTPKQAAEIHAEEVRIGTSFSRTEPMYMPIYKDFDERIGSDVRSRFAKAFGSADFLSQNIDGESVATACMRLMRQREPRKVMMVFSDGEPACATRHHTELYASLHKAVANAKKMGIEIIGIGIEDDSVKTFFPQYVVLENVAELPKVVMGEMRRILLSSRK